MDINAEANGFKIEMAKNLKQLSENAEVVIGKKVENNTTEIKIEDKSTHLTFNFNFVGVVPTEEQIKGMTQRVKEVLSGQSEVIEASGDKSFLPYVAQGLGVVTATTGTANAVLLKNSDYIFNGMPKPIFFTPPGALPVSVSVFTPIVSTEQN